MDNSIEIILRDDERKEEFRLQLSPTSAFKAQNDLSFATTLLNVARQEYHENSACVETSENAQISSEYSNDTRIEEICGNISHEERETGQEIEEDKENFRWSHEAIMLLLEEYRKGESAMSSGRVSRKKAWNDIAASMKKKEYCVSGRQCMTRINTMKRTFKSIKDHNAKSGNNTRTWKYYEIMDNFLKQKPYITPLATISSTGASTSTSEAATSPGSSSSNNTLPICQSSSTVPRKRKASDVLDTLLEHRRLAEEARNKRHEERIQMGQKILNKLDQLVDKM